MPVFNAKSNTKIVLAALVFAALFFGGNQIIGFYPVETAPIIFSNYLATALGAFIGIYGAIKIGMRNFIGKGVFFLGCASLFSFIGYILWDWADFILEEELPYPSIADFSWSASVSIAIVGILFLLRVYQPQVKFRYFLEAAGIFTLMSAIIIYIVGWPDLSEATFSTGFFDIFYTLSDSLWIAIGVITLRIAGGKIFPGLLAYTVSMFVMVIGDILFAIRVANGTFYYGDIADLMLLFAWILAALGIYLTVQTFSNGQSKLNA